MLCGGLDFNAADRLRILTGADPTPTYWNNGFPFTDERLVISTGAPAGSIYNNGFRFSAKGALYGVNSASAPAGYINGVGVDANGAVIFGNLVLTAYDQGMGYVSTGRVSTINS